MRVRVDTNIMLGALLEREPFANDARALLRQFPDSQQSKSNRQTVN